MVHSPYGPLNGDRVGPLRSVLTSLEKGALQVAWIRELRGSSILFVSDCQNSIEYWRLHGRRSLIGRSIA